MRVNAIDCTAKHRCCSRTRIDVLLLPDFTSIFHRQLVCLFGLVSNFLCTNAHVFVLLIITMSFLCKQWSSSVSPHFTQLHDRMLIMSDTQNNL